MRRTASSARVSRLSVSYDYCRANAVWCAVEKEKNEIIKNMKRQVFFIYLSFRIAFLVRFWENVWFAFYVPCYYCVVPVGKHSNSRSQIFYDALQNLAIFTRKHLCCRYFLINFNKKRLQHRCFPVNVAKCLSTAFHIEIYVNTSFLNVMLCYHFSLGAFLQDMAKNNPTEKQIEAKIIKRH